VANDETRSEAQEAHSLRRYRALFASALPGDLARILALFWTRHRLYQGAQFSDLRQRTEDSLRALPSAP
jgi:hypothetical protein